MTILKAISRVEFEIRFAIVLIGLWFLTKKHHIVDPYGEGIVKRAKRYKMAWWEYQWSSVQDCEDWESFKRYQNNAAEWMRKRVFK